MGEKRKYSVCGQERTRSTAGGSNIPCRKQLVHCASRHPSIASKAQVRCRRAILRPCHACPRSRLLDPKPKPHQGQASAVLAEPCRLSRGIIVNLEAAVRGATSCWSPNVGGRGRLAVSGWQLAIGAVVSLLHAEGQPPMACWARGWPPFVSIVDSR
jgi:hypothetical protein